MFNAPRTSPSAQRYNASNSILGGFVDDNPLAASVFDDGGLDPWSGIPSTPALPARTPLPSMNIGSSGNDNLGVFANIIGTEDSIRSLHNRFTRSGFFAAGATVPAIYSKALASVDPTSTGETSVNALVRVLSTSALPASTIDKVPLVDHALLLRAHPANSHLLSPPDRQSRKFTTTSFQTRVFRRFGTSSACSKWKRCN